jgi:hypothetical protein
MDGQWGEIGHTLILILLSSTRSNMGFGFGRPTELDVELSAGATRFCRE